MSRDVVVHKLPLERFKVKDDTLFRDGAYFIRFPRTFNMSLFDGVQLIIETLESSSAFTDIQPPLELPTLSRWSDGYVIRHLNNCT